MLYREKQTTNKYHSIIYDTMIDQYENDAGSYSFTHS